MPTSTDVTNLKINQLTEAQYDTAVQGGVIGANELSILTDAEVGQTIQVDVLPTAGADELGNIYQFVGTTDSNYTNGYFYKCVSDGATPAVYSWEAVEVQASSGGLPDQTGQSGKFLTTDGTDASWSDKPLVNTATGSNSLTILGTAHSRPNSINIGVGSFIGGDDNLAIGKNAQTYVSNNIAIGNGARVAGTGHSHSIALGVGAIVNAKNAVQIGGSTNSDADTFKFCNSNSNFEVVSADGTIPEARLADTTSATAGQVLTLDNNLNAVWAPSGGSGGGVSDVTVNGTSVVSGGVATITCATIDDTSTSSLTATWSASKLNTTIGNIESLLAAI